MTTMLAGEQERWVADNVRERSYASPEHLAARDERARGLESLRADIAVGWDQAKRGELVNWSGGDGGIGGTDPEVLVTGRHYRLSKTDGLPKLSSRPVVDWHE